MKATHTNRDGDEIAFELASINFGTEGGTILMTGGQYMRYGWELDAPEVITAGLGFEPAQLQDLA